MPFHQFYCITRGKKGRTNYPHFSCTPPPKPPHSYPCTCLSALHCRIRQYCAQPPLCIQPKPGSERCVAYAEQLQQIKAPLLPFLPLRGFIPPPQNPRAPSGALVRPQYKSLQRQKCPVQQDFPHATCSCPAPGQLEFIPWQAGQRWLAVLGGTQQGQSRGCSGPQRCAVSPVQTSEHGKGAGGAHALHSSWGARADAPRGAH